MSTEPLSHKKGIACETHGDTMAAYVCQHIDASQADKTDPGVVWGRDEEGYINAWCADCDGKLMAAGGEWTDDVTEAVNLRAMCETCFEAVKEASGAARQYD